MHRGGVSDKGGQGRCVHVSSRLPEGLDKGYGSMKDEQHEQHDRGGMHPPVFRNKKNMCDGSCISAYSSLCPNLRLTHTHGR